MKKASTKFLPMIFMLSLLFFSCNKEEISSNEAVLSETEETVVTKNTNTTAKTECDILGCSVASPGTTATYTYTSNFSPSNITWTPSSGIIILSGQGTNTVTVQFSSSFNGGSLLGNGSSGNIVCSESLSISKVTPPSYIDINQTAGACMGDVFTFQAVPNEPVSGASYQWTVFQGASIISGQGTNTIQVQSPSSGGFSIRVTVDSTCPNVTVTGFNLAEFSASCGGGGGGLGGF